MEKIQTSEVIVRIPPSVAADIGNDEIISVLRQSAIVLDFDVLNMKMIRFLLRIE